jgi:hypothetical protein
MRGTGTTTQQMKAAPKNATYIWVHGDTYYPKQLAKELGRTDLKIVGPDWLTDYRFMGLRDLEVVIDHATELSPRQLAVWHELATRLKR